MKINTSHQFTSYHQMNEHDTVEKIRPSQLPFRASSVDTSWLLVLAAYSHNADYSSLENSRARVVLNLPGSSQSRHHSSSSTLDTMISGRLFSAAKLGPVNYTLCIQGNPDQPQDCERRSHHGYPHLGTILDSIHIATQVEPAQLYGATGPAPSPVNIQHGIPSL